MVHKSANLNNVVASNVDAPGAAMTKFAQFKANKADYNVTGSVIGLANTKGATQAEINVKFMNCGEPVFLYNATKTLNIIYDEVKKGSLVNE